MPRPAARALLNRFQAHNVTHWTLADSVHAARGAVPPGSSLLFWRKATTEPGRRTLKLVWAMLLAQLLVGMGIGIWGLVRLVRTGTGGHALADLGVGLLMLLLFGLSWRVTDVLARQLRDSAVARAVAAGAVASLIQTRFTNWGLTPAEHDVALFTLKGFETQEVAEMRGTSQGTVRVQLARVYEKAGVGSRGAFLCLFVEDLLDIVPVTGASPKGPGLAIAAQPHRTDGGPLQGGPEPGPGPRRLTGN